MKHADKLFLIVSIAVLGCSFWYYSSSMPTLDVEKSKHSSKLKEVAKGFMNILLDVRNKRNGEEDDEE